MNHEKLDSISVAMIICCTILMLTIGLCVYVVINMPIVDDENDQEIKQGLTYTDYVDFVVKEEKCQN